MFANLNSKRIYIYIYMITVNLHRPSKTIQYHHTAAHHNCPASHCISLHDSAPAPLPTDLFFPHRSRQRMHSYMHSCMHNCMHSCCAFFPSFGVGDILFSAACMALHSVVFALFLPLCL